MKSIDNDAAHEVDISSLVPMATINFLLVVGIVFALMVVFLLYLGKCCCFQRFQGYTCFDPKPVGKCCSLPSLSATSKLTTMFGAALDIT